MDVEIAGPVTLVSEEDAGRIGNPGNRLGSTGGELIGKTAGNLDIINLDTVFTVILVGVTPSISSVAETARPGQSVP